MLILGLAAAVAAPSFILRAPPTEASSAIDVARGVALKRAELMFLSLNPTGDWRVNRPSTGVTIISGRIDVPPPTGVEIEISPLGVCVLRRGSLQAPGKRFDPLSCRLEAVAAEMR